MDGTCPMSVRETILTALEGELATITVANGYESAVAEVLRNVPHSDDLTTKVDAVTLVLSDDGQDKHIGYGGGNKALKEITVEVRCYVQCYRNDEPTGEIGKIEADIHKLIDKPVSLGSNARFAQVKNVVNTILAERVGVVTVTIAIVYWYTRTAP